MDSPPTNQHGLRTQAYTGCQFVPVYPPGCVTKPELCPNVAIMMPGYKRACARHLIDVLLDSIEQYLEAPRTPADVEYLTRLITYLEDAPE